MNTNLKRTLTFKIGLTGKRVFSLFFLLLLSTMFFAGLVGVPAIVKATGETPYSLVGEDYQLITDYGNSNLWDAYLPDLASVGNKVSRLWCRPSTFPACTVGSIYNPTIMDSVVAKFQAYDMQVVIAHLNWGDSVGFYGSDEWWDWWISIFTRYKDNSGVVGFQIANEPESYTWSDDSPIGVIDSQADLNTVFKMLIDAGIAIAPTKKFFYPNIWWCGDGDDIVWNWATYIAKIEGCGIQNYSEVIFDVCHPYMFAEQEAEYTPEEYIDEIWATSMTAAISYFGANRCWIGETYADGESLTPSIQIEFLTRLINKCVEDGVGFQIVQYARFYDWCLPAIQASLWADTYTLILSIVTPTTATKTSSTVAYSVYAVGNDTSPTYQINLYKSGSPVGTNKTAITSTFTGLSNGTYVFACLVTGSHGTKDYETVTFDVSIYTADPEPPPTEEEEDEEILELAEGYYASVDYFTVDFNTYEAFQFQDLTHDALVVFEVQTGDLEGLASLTADSAGGSITIIPSTVGMLFVTSTISEVWIKINGITQTAPFTYAIGSAFTVSWTWTATPVFPSGPVGWDWLLGGDISLLLAYLQAGDYLGFIMACYTTRIGQLAYVLIILMFTIPLALRTQSITYVAIVWMILGVIFQTAVPLIGPATVILEILGIGALLFRLFARE